MTKSIVFAIVCGFLLSAAAGAAEWHERIKVGGDIRCRGEVIDRESDAEAPVIALVSDGRDARARIRARLRVTGEAGERWRIGLGLVTGSDDPVSTDETLSGGFSKKGIALDLAYLEFRPGAVAGLRCVAGKMNLPFEVAGGTELMWDEDLTPEGLAINYRRGASEGIGIFLNGAGFEIRDTSPDEIGEAWMLGAQAGVDIRAPRGIGITAAAGYYNYEGAYGEPGFHEANEFYGNSSRLWRGTKEIGGRPYAVSYLGYAHDYNIVEALAVVELSPRDRFDIAVFGTYLSNIRTGERNTAYLAGGSVSRGRDRGAMRLSASYRDVESDAVIGAFADSDFLGGGTNGSGWELGCALGAAKGIDLGATWFLNTKRHTGDGGETEYERLQVDVRARF